MSQPTPQNPTGAKATEPALYVTTQTTIPILTQIMAGFSLAAIGVAGSATWSETLPLLYQPSTKNISLSLLSISALLFLFATEACVKSQAWDYYALSDERRKFDDLRDTVNYISVCINESHKWHRIAVWSYRFGIISIMLGVAFLFWPISKSTSIIVGLYLPISLILALIVYVRGKWIIRRIGP